MLFFKKNYSQQPVKNFHGKDFPLYEMSHKFDYVFCSDGCHTKVLINPGENTA